MWLTNKLNIYFYILFFLCSCGGSQESRIPIQDFFEKTEKTSFKLSPDGSKVAYLGLEDHCRNIFVLDIVNPDSSKQLTYQDNMNVQYFFWATNDSIVYSNSQSFEDSLRLYTIDIRYELSKPLIPVDDHQIRWLNTPRSFGGNILALMNKRDSSVFDLYRIRLDGGGAMLVDQNPGNFSSWFASSDGKVRLVMSSDSVVETFWYRAEEGLPFSSVIKTDFESTIFPLGPAKGDVNSMYALSNIGRDKLALVEMGIQHGRETRVIFADKDADVNREGYFFSNEEPLFSTVYKNHKQVVIHNPKLAEIYKHIKKKFNDYSIDILDVDSMFNTLVFKTYTDRNPGSIYYYHTDSDKVVELTAQNPKLTGRYLGEMKEVSYYSRDGKTIKGYLTYPLKEQKSYPVVVLVHDGPNRRDIWGFNAEVQFLANRGYAVFQVNYRGSTGFGKEFFTAGFKQWGGEIQNDISDGVTWLIHQGIADKNRIAIMGVGFGGYSALYAACFNPTLYKCAISSSGYTNLFTYFKEIPPYYQQYLKLYAQIIGDPTREYELFKAISPLFHTEKVNIPILFFQGGKDKHSSVTDANQFVQKVKNRDVPIRYVYKEEEGKRFRKEENTIEYYQEVEAFLAMYLD